MDTKEIDMVLCEYCHLEIYKGYIDTVKTDTIESFIDGEPDIPIIWHRMCYNYNKWLGEYYEKLAESKSGLVNDSR